MIEHLAEGNTTTKNHKGSKTVNVSSWHGWRYGPLYKPVRMSTLRNDHHSKMANIQENSKAFDTNGRQEEEHVSSVLPGLGNNIIINC